MGQVAQIAAQHHSWTTAQHRAYIRHWQRHAGQFRRLRTYAQQGQLSPTQKERYRLLVRLVAQHLATLERIFEG